MIKKVWEKNIAVILVLTILISFMPEAIHAEPATETADFNANAEHAIELLGGNEYVEYDADNNEITLKGVDFSTSASVAVILPDGVTLVLESGTDNRIISTHAGEYDSYGILIDSGDLTICGDGTLEVIGGTGDNSSYGISASSITITEGEVTATGGAAGRCSYGISAQSITISGGRVTGRGGNGFWESYGIHASHSTGCISISGSADVIATCEATNDCSEAITASTITISGGKLTATGEGCAIAAYDSFEISGGTVTAIGSAVALSGAPELDDYSDYTAVGARSITGSDPADPEPYNDVYYDEYKYFSIKPLISIVTAEITDMIAPAAGAAPITSGSLTAGGASYMVTDLTWQNSDGSAAALTAEGKFEVDSTYRAVIELTAAAGYKFQELTPVIDHGTADAGTIDGDGEGNKLNFTVTFDPTAALQVIGIAVTIQPAKLSYTEGTDGILALNGMVVTETYNDGSTADVTFTDGTAAGYTTNPTNGTALTNAAHNNSAVTVTHIASGLTAQTNNLTVNSAPSSGDSGDDSDRDSGRRSGSSTSSTPSVPSANTGVDILVNGKKETAAAATTIRQDNKTVTTVVVDDKKVEQRLAREGSNAIVTIPINNSADVVAGQLNGQTVKNMENKDAVLEIRTGQATYTLPASQINIDDVSEQVGEDVELKDIAVSIKISEPAADTVKIVEDTANKNNYQIVVKPIEFEITCSRGDKTVEVSKFSAYVERMIAIPEGIDPSKITTGVILNPDGTFSHVPTVITMIDGKYYAKINSLTNSAYLLIYSPKTFKDTESHWAKEAVDDMASRLVANGVDEDRFEPDRDITRAEFAAIAVRALGLMRHGTGKDIFKDAPMDAWYYDAVTTAYEYNLIDGYGDGQFGAMDKITREQAMTIVARATNITKLKAGMTESEVNKVLAGFTDANSTADYAKTGIAACVKTGIISGRSKTTLAPKDNITRAEVAAAIRRLLQKSNLID